MKKCAVSGCDATTESKVAFYRFEISVCKHHLDDCLECATHLGYKINLLILRALKMIEKKIPYNPDFK
jgi:hypothetical protein